MSWLNILRLVGTATSLAEAYAKIRALAARDGVSEEDLAAADTRWSMIHPDPLLKNGPNIPIPDDPPKKAKYLTPLTTYPKRDDYRFGDMVYRKGLESVWTVVNGKVGIGKPVLPWYLVETF